MDADERKYRLWLIKQAYLAHKAKKYRYELSKDTLKVKLRRSTLRKGKYFNAGGGHRIIKKLLHDDDD